jgi:hypothetical protein
MYHNFQVDRYAKSGKCLCIMKSIYALLFIESVGLSDVLPCLINYRCVHLHIHCFDQFIHLIYCIRKERLKVSLLFVCAHRVVGYGSV